MLVKLYRLSHDRALRVTGTHSIVGELTSEGLFASIGFHDRLCHQLLDAICPTNYSLTAGTDQTTDYGYHDRSIDDNIFPRVKNAHFGGLTQYSQRNNTTAHSAVADYPKHRHCRHKCREAARMSRMFALLCPRHVRAQDA